MEILRIQLQPPQERPVINNDAGAQTILAAIQEMLNGFMEPPPEPITIEVPIFQADTVQADLECNNLIIQGMQDQFRLVTASIIRQTPPPSPLEPRKPSHFPDTSNPFQSS